MKKILTFLAVVLLITSCNNNPKHHEDNIVLEKRTDGSYYLEKHTGEGGYRNELYSITLHTALNCPKIQKGVYKCCIDSINSFLRKKKHNMRSFQFCATCFTTQELDSIDDLLNK